MKFYYSPNLNWITFKIANNWWSKRVWWAKLTSDFSQKKIVEKNVEHQLN